MPANKPPVQKKSSRGDPSRQPSVIDVSDEEEGNNKAEADDDAAESLESELS